MNYPFALSDEADTLEALERCNRMRMQEIGEAECPVRGMHRAQVSCTGFFQANPNVQIAYAEQNGFYPDTGQLPCCED